MCPPSARLRAAAFGVAGPVVHDRAKLTNVGWTIAAADIRSHLDTPHVELLNNLASMARSIEVLTPDELLVLQEGTPDDEASAAVIAAGTGMGRRTCIDATAGCCLLRPRAGMPISLPAPIASSSSFACCATATDARRWNRCSADLAW